MKIVLALLALVLGSLGAEAVARRLPPLRNPALLNIGFVCQWQAKCMKRQEQAMNRALKHVRKSRPAAWKVQLCNRNASRRYSRVDWTGYFNCIRNPKLQPPPARRLARRSNRR
jgi:hypothetical protein